MTRFSITYCADVPSGAVVLAPAGLATPQSRVISVDLDNGVMEQVIEERTGQTLLIVHPTEGRLGLTYHFEDQGQPYPDAIFHPHASRYTSAAAALVEEASAIAPDAPAADRARAIACATAERFTYGHPEARFTDGHDEIPALGCGLAEGSCVDINTYFIASLRAAGIEAGYVTGFFFPAEKGTWCNDGHCWVVTRIGGVVQEWDIAHHLKLGTRDIHPGLNPKPGFRAACAHSMGLAIPALGVSDLKALIDPCMIVEGRQVWFDHPDIRLTHPAITAPVKVGA